MWKLSWNAAKRKPLFSNIPHNILNDVKFEIFRQKWWKVRGRY